MKTLTIRNVPDEVHAALRVRAAQRGWSMEEEVRRTLAESVASRSPPLAPSPEAGGRAAAAGQGELSYPERRDGESKTQGLGETAQALLGGSRTPSGDAWAAVEELRALIRAANEGRLPSGAVDGLIAERRAEAARDLAVHAESLVRRRKQERRP